MMLPGRSPSWGAMRVDPYADPYGVSIGWTRQFVTDSDLRVFREKGLKVVVPQWKIPILAAHNPEVVGSSPASATKKPPFFKVKRWFFFAKSSDFLTPKLTPKVRGVYLGFTAILEDRRNGNSELF